MKKVEIGESSIQFKKKDYLGNNIDLRNYKDKRVLLTFFRGASCPFCNLRVNKLINRYQEFEEKNIAIITLFASSQNEIIKYTGNQNAPFPIIPDPKLELYKKYGIEESILGMFKTMFKFSKVMEVMNSSFFNLKAIKDKHLIPADFLIDEEQKIYRAYYGKDFGDHLQIEKILAWEKI